MNSDSEQVTIEWSDFGGAIASDLFQFFNSDDYSDVTICTEDGPEIKSHRILLAMCSDYFRDLFKRNQRPNSAVCLSMRYNIVKYIFILIYGGQVRLPSSDMESFVKAAQFLKLQGFENVSTNMKELEDEINKKTICPSISINLKRIDDVESTPNNDNGMEQKPPEAHSHRSMSAPAVESVKEEKKMCPPNGSDGHLSGQQRLEIDDDSSESEDIIVD